MSAYDVSRLDRALAVESRRSIQNAADGLSALMDVTRRLATQRNGLLGELVPCAAAVLPWAHLPADDAYDARSGYRWYYHCHAREARTVGEHGHFHLFADSRSASGVTHLIAVSVCSRGLPLGLFTTNRWVTDESWQPAARVLRLISGFALSSPAHLRRAHRWLGDLLRGFAPQIRTLLLERDERLSNLRASARSEVMEDRRIAVLSRCRIDVFAQAAAIDRWRSRADIN